MFVEISLGTYGTKGIKPLRWDPRPNFWNGLTCKLVFHLLRPKSLIAK